MYHYKCQAIRTIDGDTVELDIDLGLHVHVRRIVRLRGINAPEIRGETREDGERTKRRLVELIDQAAEDLCCITHLDKSDKYGRLLVALYPHATAVVSFNDTLVRERLAVPYMA